MRYIRDERNDRYKRVIDANLDCEFLNDSSELQSWFPIRQRIGKSRQIVLMCASFGHTYFNRKQFGDDYLLLSIGDS